jgi:hypothetical protein
MKYVLLLLSQVSNWNVARLFDIAGSIVSGGFSPAQPVSVIPATDSEGDILSEAHSVYDMLSELLDDSKKYAIKVAGADPAKFTKAQILLAIREWQDSNALPKKPLAVVDGRHRYLAWVIVQALGLHNAKDLAIVNLDISEGDAALAAIRANQVTEKHRTRTKADRLQETVNLMQSGKVTRQAQVEANVASSYGDAQWLFPAATLVLRGLKADQVLPYDKEVLRKAVSESLGVDDAIEKIKELSKGAEKAVPAMSAKSIREIAEKAEKFLGDTPVTALVKAIATNDGVGADKALAALAADKH